MVEALIQASYFVLADNDFRVKEVMLAGTVMAEYEQNRKQQLNWKVRYCEKKKQSWSPTTKQKTVNAKTQNQYQISLHFI